MTEEVANKGRDTDDLLVSPRSYAAGLDVADT
jgi:hypothetical protein